MILDNQKALVRRLSKLAAARSCEAAAHRKVVRNWKRDRIGTTGTLVWFFAAGVLWGAGRGRGAKKSAGLPRLAVGAANTSLLTWRFLNDTSVESADALASGSVAEEEKS